MSARALDKTVCRKVQGKAEEGNTCLQTPGTCESCPEWAGKGKQISFTVPLIPPNLNHYKVPIWKQRRFAVTSPAAAFKQAVAIFSRGGYVMAKQFIVEATVYLGKKQKGDVDGFGKLIMDSLADAYVFRDLENEPVSDAHVYDLHLRKRRDEENPRTEITVKAMEA